MRLLAFDGRMGASGDMLLAALLDAGADPSVLDPVEARLDVEYVVGSTTKCGIDATTVDVLLTESADSDAEGNDSDADSTGDEPTREASHDRGDRDREPDENSGHAHEHADHEHTRGDGHARGEDRSRGDDHEYGDRVRAEGHGPHRSYPEVREIVGEMDLPGPVEADALAIFEVLGEAEASVHGTALEETCFHEVGADDAVADVVGCALLVADVDPDRIVTTPLAAGGGSVSMSHGEYPVPTPAVVEIAARADWSLRGGPVDRELLTPTGAAILGHYADGVDALPPISLEESGYGAGGYDLDPHPNVLRVLVGETDATGALVREDIAVLETNLDDATPEVLGGLQETLADAGARDVSVLPATMKKARPGHLVKVICRPADRERVARKLAEETGTLGIRDAGVTHRWIARRTLETVELEIGGATHEVSVKVASDDDGTVYDVSAEYDDAAAVAAETGRSIREVAGRAERAVLDALSE